MVLAGLVAVASVAWAAVAWRHGWPPWPSISFGPPEDGGDDVVPERTPATGIVIDPARWDDEEE